MPGRWARLALLSGLLLVASCTLVNNNQQGQNSPDTTASTAAQAPPLVGPIVVETPSSAPASPKPAVLNITSASFHVGEVGFAYTPVGLAAAGGVPPYSWNISVGALPGGLNASPTGTVSGTPALAGTSAFTVRVADAAGGTATVNRSIAVVRHLSVSGVCTSRCSVEQGCMTVCGRFGSQTGGASPYHYAKTGGTLPPGMGLSGLSLTGPFPLTPPAALVLPWKFAVTVTDALGVTGSVTAVYYVFPHIAFTATSGTCSGFVVSGCTTTLQYTGGTPNGTPKVNVTLSSANGPLPAGSTFTAAKNVVSVSIAGSSCSGPYGNTGYDAVVALVLVDQSPCGVGFNCSSGKLSLTVHLLVC